MRPMEAGGLVAVLGLAAWIGVGCGTGRDFDGGTAVDGTAQSSVPSGATDFEIRTSDGAWYQGHAVISIRYDTTLREPVIEMDLGGDAHGAAWRAILRLPREVLLQKQGAVPVGLKPGVPGAGTVEGWRAGTTTRATAGTLSFALTGRTISGRATVSPEALSATFSGIYRLECTVPPAMLEEKPGYSKGSHTPGPGVLVTLEDTSLSTPVCRQFASILQ